METERRRKHHHRRHEDGEPRKRKHRSRSRSASPTERPETAALELARLRAACEQLRALLRSYPGERKALRELLWSVDAGQGVALANVTDQGLKCALESLFASCRLHLSPAGTYVARSGATPLLRSIGSVFDEKLAAAPEATPPVVRRHAAPIGPARPPRAEELYRGPAPADLPESDSDEPPAAAIGPSGPPPVFVSLPPPSRRVIGPAAPPREVLEAAQLERLGAVEPFGPAPPELVLEADATSAEAREQAVTRLLRLASAAPPSDAYDVLGLEEGAGAAEVRRAFWRASLLVHPDKCAHPQAKDAFALLSRAKDLLSDADKRAALDAGRKERALRAEFEQELLGRLQAAQWRRARAMPPLEGDAELLASSTSGGGRESWMTELPPERRPGTGPPTASVTSFSRRGVEGRGDARAWTETPQSRADALQSLCAVPLSALEGERAVESTAQAVDAYNAHSRPKSMLEAHREARGQAPAPVAAQPSLYFTGDKGKRTFL